MDCPSCDKSLPTVQGMRIHHAKVHGERLPNRTCKDCGTQFYDPKSQRKYCGNCNPYAGRNNGNWNDAKETAECRLCGVAFEYYPSDKKGVYCSTCVENYEGFLGTPYDEVHDIERVSRRCEQCGEEMLLLKSYVDQHERNGRFCSHECRCIAMKESNDANSYNKGWIELRRRAIRRDGESCQKCGVHKSTLDYDLDVHHLKPVREFEDPTDAHTLSNVICLCRSCHISVEWELRSINNSARNE